MDVTDLVLELFGAAQTAEPSDGLALERSMVDRLHQRGARMESIPGGCQLYGFASQSGLAHQLDLVVGLDGADAIVELKANRSSLPKDGLLRFKAATDDYFVGLGRELPNRPIYRVYGGLGTASRGMRRFAALHGIAVVEGDRWPSCALGSDDVSWPDEDGPSVEARRMLRRLVRPMQEVLHPVRDGYLVPPWPEAYSPDAILDVQDEWSSRVWGALDLSGLDDDRAAGRWPA